MADTDFTCLTCKHFRNAAVMGSCSRYPQTLNKHQNDYCGEYAAKKAQLLSLPVYDIMTDTVKEAPDAPVVKRKYTRKVAA